MTVPCTRASRATSGYSGGAPETRTGSFTPWPTRTSFGAGGGGGSGTGGAGATPTVADEPRAPRSVEPGPIGRFGTTGPGCGSGSTGAGLIESGADTLGTERVLRVDVSRATTSG